MANYVTFTFTHLHLLTSTCEFIAVVPSCTPSFIPAFSINARSDWLKQRALSENKERVNNIKLALIFLHRYFDKFGPNAISLVRLRQNQYKRDIFQQ